MDPSEPPDAVLESRIRQQEVVAELGQRALNVDDLDELMEDVAEAVVETLGTEYSGIIELTADGDEAVLRHGVGWKADLVGNATIPADRDTLSGRALQTAAPVIVDDVQTDDEFGRPDLLGSHDVVGGISVVLGPGAGPWGALSAYTTERREFTENDARFLESVANVLESAIENTRTRNELEEIYGRISNAFFALDEQWRFTYLNERAHELLVSDGRELEGRNVWEAFPAATDRAFKEQYERAMGEQETVSFEEYYPEPLDAWFEVRAYPSETGLSVYFRDVTDRKERERELETRSAAIEETIEGIGILDGNEEYVFVNQAHAEIYGYDDPEAFLGETWRTCYDDDEVERLEDEAMSELFEAGSWRGKATGTREDGSTFPQEVSLTALDDERLICVVRDVTERRARERELERFETLFTESRDVNAVLEPDGAFQYVTPSMENVLGYDPQELVGENAFDYVHPEDRKRVSEEFATLVEDRDHTPTVEYRFRHADGSWRVVESRGRNLLDEQAIGGIVVYSRDVTDREERERELAERERQLSTLMSNVPGMVYRCGNKQGWPMAFVSDGCRDLTGYEPEALTDGDVSFGEDVVVATDREGLWEDVQRGLAEDGQFLVTYRIETAAGTVKWVRERGRGVYDDNGELAGLEGVIIDVTERKRLESELQEVFGRITDAFYALDEEYRFTHVNERAEELLDRPQGELLGERLWDAFPETAEREEIRERFRGAMETQEPTSIEVYTEALGFWVEANLYPSETGLSVYFQDVSDRKERQRALEESERRYRTLVENFPNGAVGLVDEDLRYQTVGGRPVSEHAETGDDLEGQLVREALTAELADVMTSAYGAALDGESSTFEVEHHGRHSRFHVFPVRGQDGEVFAAMGMSQDVTEQRERQRNLERYETIVETVNDGVYVVDEDGLFATVNEAYADMVGYDREELVGAPATRVVDEELVDQVEALQVATDEGSVDRPSMEAELETAGGEPLPVEATFASMPRGDDSDWHRIGVVRDISDRRERQRALEESERRYRTLVENFPDGAVGLFDDDLQYTAAGGEMLDEIGVRAEDRIGSSVYESYPDEIVAEIEPFFQAALDGEANTFEVDYHARHLLAHTLPVRDAADEVFAGMLVVQDITDRKEMERELRQSEAKFRMIAENLEEVVWMATPQADEFVYVNPAFEAVWGRDREVLFDEPLSFVDAVHEADRDHVRERFTALPEDDFDEEFRIVRPDGEVRWVHARGTSVTDGEMTRVVGIGEDVSERVEREQELERALDLLERAEHIADVGGWEIDVDTSDVFWTDQVFDLLSVTADEEPPLDEALAMYHEGDRPIVVDAVEEAMDSGDPFDVEARVRTGSGEVRWLRLQGVPETVDGEVVSLRGAAQDVTERKQREQRLKELIERLEESNERLEQFAYAASHDLQEPLRMVSSYLQLLEDRYADALDEDAEEFIEFAVDGADRMRDMIEGLLEYSRIDSRGDPFGPVDLDAVFADVRQDLRVKIERSDAEISAEELPRVEGDAGQLRQVFQNLLSNAIEYSGDEPPRIHVSAERDGDEWVISVHDEGVGIDPDDQERVFEVFQRLHSRDAHEGTGIGLALCERIVERHGGDIWVESEPGEGSTFSVTLAAVEAEDD